MTDCILWKTGGGVHYCVHTILSLDPAISLTSRSKMFCITVLPSAILSYSWALEGGGGSFDVKTYRYIDSSKCRCSESQRSGDRILVGGKIFRTRFDRLRVPHSLLYSRYAVSSPGVKRPGRGVNHPTPSSAEVKERIELYLYSPYRPFWSVLGRTLPLS
jgi:hypothetical protein